MSDFTVDRDFTKRVLGSAGTLVSYGTDEPAFEFNADGSYKGLLVEPAATNLCLQSEDFGTTWTGVSGFDLDATTAPDGTSTADRIRGDGLGGGDTQLYRNQTITVTAEATYTASVFAKADALSWIRIGDAGSIPFAFFDLSNGVVGTTGGTDDESIEDYGNGWYRCSITWTQGVGDTSFVFRISIAEDDNDLIVPRLPSSASSVFLWGAQVEAGPIATSYIQTTDAQVIRAKDDITLGSASSLIGQTEGTLYVEVDWNSKYADATDATSFPRFLTISDGTSDEFITIFLSRSSNQIKMAASTGGSPNEVDQGVTASGLTGIQKFALTYQISSSATLVLYRNGADIKTASSIDLSTMSTLTDVDLGQSPNAIAQSNMHIRAVALFSTALSEADAEALTTL